MGVEERIVELETELSTTTTRISTSDVLKIRELINNPLNKILKFKTGGKYHWSKVFWGSPQYDNFQCIFEQDGSRASVLYIRNNDYATIEARLF